MFSPAESDVKTAGERRDLKELDGFKK